MYPSDNAGIGSRLRRLRLQPHDINARPGGRLGSGTRQRLQTWSGCSNGFLQSSGGKCRKDIVTAMLGHWRMNMARC
eukprot:3822881-Pyramimonas_sp.AAC.1